MDINGNTKSSTDISKFIAHGSVRQSLNELLMDIPDILSASDCFVFPSIYEGVSVSLIEAQANGLFCVASANISRETKVTNNIKYIDIDNSEDIWIDEINNAASIDRLQAYEEVKKSNYNIANTVMELQRVYLN